jgi:hypothetical protein
MDHRPTDALEMLLPDAAPQFWQRAQRVTTFLRLLSDDGRGSGAASVGVSLARAHGEFERAASQRLARIHEELLRHHLYALLGPDSFLHCGECEGPLQQAWSALEEERGETDGLCHVPMPGERTEQVVRRLIEGLEHAGAGSARVGLWRARLARAEAGPLAGERAHRSLLESVADRGTPGGRAPAGLGSRALAGMLECQLDRGAVRLARARLEEEGARALSDPRLRRLAAWTRALCGDDGGARALLGFATHGRRRLPRPLAELRARVPAFAACFSGQPSASTARSSFSSTEGLDLVCEGGAAPGFPEAVHPLGADATATGLAAAAALARGSFGATLFAAWVLVSPGRARLAAHAVAPALAGRLRDWRQAREGVWSDRREPEAQLLADAQSRIVHRLGADEGAAGPRNPIDPQGIRAAALVPVTDAAGDVLGWLHWEFEHHLVPSQARLWSLSRTWRGRLEPKAPPPLSVLPAAPEVEGSIAAAVLGGFVDGLNLKTTQRRWSAFLVGEQGPVLVAQGGSGFEAEDEGADLGLGLEPPAASEGCPNRGLDGPATQGVAPRRSGNAGGEGALSRGRAVARAVASGQSVSFGEGEARLALHPGAASGVAVPLGVGGRVAGAWLVESRRRRDFGPADVARFEARARAVTPELLAARFRVWHRARFGHDVHVESSVPVAGLGPGPLVALAASRATVALSGPLGSGRRTLARRLHFEAGRRGAQLHGTVLGSPELESRLTAPGDSAETAPDLIVEGVLDAPREAQLRLARHLEHQRPAGPRLFLLLESPVRAAVEQGRLAPELGWLASQVELCIAPLAQRRREIVPLARLFAAHYAAEGAVRAPRLEDSALAFLWRQSWTGNVRELAQWMYRLVLCHPDRDVDGRILEELALGFGHPFQRRLPSRGPERELLVSALECTMNGKGNWNKTRAALYLGWDTDTLQSRMQEAGLGPNPAEVASAGPPRSELAGSDLADSPLDALSAVAPAAGEESSVPGP